MGKEDRNHQTRRGTGCCLQHGGMTTGHHGLPGTWGRHCFVGSLPVYFPSAHLCAPLPITSPPPLSSPFSAWPPSSEIFLVSHVGVSSLSCSTAPISQLPADPATSRQPPGAAPSGSFTSAAAFPLGDPSLSASPRSRFLASHQEYC